MLTFSDFCLSLTRLPEIRPKASPPWLLAGPFAPIRRTCQTFHGSMAAAEFRVIFTISTHTRTAGQAQYHHHANFFLLCNTSLMEDTPCQPEWNQKDWCS